MSQPQATAAPPQLGDVLPVFAAMASFGLLWMASFVPLAIWTYRSATAAAALRLPATLPPAWAVAGWVIPTANIVLPYFSVRDCLPPGHPERRRIPLWWVGLQAVSYAYMPLGVLTIVLGDTSVLVGLVAVGVAGAVAIVVAVMGARIAERIDQAHRAAMARTKHPRAHGRRPARPTGPSIPG